MTERTKSDIAAELDAAAAGLSITAHLFEGDEYKYINPQVIFSAICGFEYTLQRLAAEVEELEL